jgi:Fur family ferric uptake transcriptional regulator
MPVSISEYRATAHDLLRSARLRTTPVRTAVLSQLLRYGRPVSHADLWGRKKIRDFNRVTVYRTLLTLQKRAIVHAVQGTDGAWRYCAHALSREQCPGNHPHFVCTRCRRMSCLLGQTMPYVKVPEGTVVEAKQFVVYGICAECAAAQGSKSQ